jgi:uncharacterized protein YgbK (DUF1537 family)
LTGGSGLALGLPGNFARAGLLPRANDTAELPVIDGFSAVLAGSCSCATQAQVDHWKSAGRPAFRIAPLSVAAGEAVVEQAIEFAQQHIVTEPVLIYATSTPEEVKAVQEKLGTEASGELVERALASIGQRLHDLGVRRYVVAGGETSGAVVNALGVKALRIGAQIDSGVPCTVSIGGTPLALALKSGNFGTVDFFSKALAMFDKSVELDQ